MIIIFKNKRRLSSSGEKTIKLLAEGLKKNGLLVKIINLEDVEIFLEKGRIKVLVDGKSIFNCKMMYFRKTGTYRNVAFIIANVAQKRNVFFVDKFYPKTCTRGKLIQMFLLSTNNLPIPKTYHSLKFDKKKLKNAIAFLKFPIVVKATNFGSGKMIFIAKTINDLRNIFKKHPDTEFILQEFIKNTFDYRVLVLGKKPSVAEKRIRQNKNEFRNNACIGGKEVFLNLKKLPKNINLLAKQAASVMDVQVAGVDIVRSTSGRDYIFEVNPSPMLSVDDKSSNELNELTKYILRCVKKT